MVLDKIRSGKLTPSSSRDSGEFRGARPDMDVPVTVFSIVDFCLATKFLHSDALLKSSESEIIRK